MIHSWLHSRHNQPFHLITADEIEIGVGSNSKYHKIRQFTAEIKKILLAKVFLEDLSRIIQTNSQTRPFLRRPYTEYISGLMKNVNPLIENMKVVFLKIV